MQFVLTPAFRAALAVSAAALAAAEGLAGSFDGAAPASRPRTWPEFKIERRYLTLPIKNGAPKHEVTLLVDGRVAVRNTIELAESAPDWWAVMEVGEWRGKTVTIRADKLREDSPALALIGQSDTLPDGAAIYQEPRRGQFHFSARRGWLNDPNGLVYHHGRYHLFFQHNPYGWAWGNMHWGHAVSRDLVRWTELPEALAPDDSGPMFSGSAVVDWQNSSGFGQPDQPALVLFYTAAGKPAVQCAAHSSDGVSFTKHPGNPILNQVTPGNRDPKVFWHEPSHHWVMVLYVELNGVHTIHFYNSSNLKDWTYLSRVDGLFECPDLYELPVDGDPAKTKWVLTAASGEYLIGGFDGKEFKPETPKLPAYHGTCCYAAQTFSDIPRDDGRRIQIGWLRANTPGMPFNQAMSVPRVVRLVSTPDGPRQTLTPVRELETLRAKSHRRAPLTLEPGAPNPLADLRAELIELRLDLEPGAAEQVVLTIRGATVSYHAKSGLLAVNGIKAPAPLIDGRLRLIAYCDRQVLEVFAGDGLVYAPVPYLPDPADLTLGIAAKGGAARIRSLEVHELKSAWADR